MSDIHSKAPCLPEAQKLYHKGNGQSNIKEFLKNFVTLMKAYHGDDGNIFLKKKYPVEWVQDWEDPAVVPKSELLQAAMLEDRKWHRAEHRRGKKVRAQMGASALLSFTKSAEDHIKRFHKSELEKLSQEDDPIGILNLAESTHTFIGKQSGYEDKDEVRSEIQNFTMDSGEQLEENFDRFSELMKKADAVEIIEEYDGKRQCHQQLKAIVSYKEGSAVNNLVINELSIVNTKDFPNNLATLQGKLLELDGTVTRMAQKPKTSKFIVNATKVGKKRTQESVSLEDGTRLERDQDGQLVVFQAGKKPNYISNKGGWNKGDKASRPDAAKRKDKRDRNPHSRRYAEKQASLTGRSVEEILKDTKCDKCGGSYHIAADCKKPIVGNSNKENKAPTSVKTGGNKNKSYMSEATGSKTDPLDSDVPIYEDETEDDEASINPRRLKGFFD